MLRIERVTADDETVIMRLAGRLIGAWVAEVACECERALSGETRLALDLAAVSFVDAAGADLLRTLAGRGVSLLRCSPFIAEHTGVRT